MAVFLQTSLSVPNSGSNAQFRAWGTYVRDAIMNCGFTMVGTGNIDWTTVAAPTLTNTPSGFEVYQFNDTLQATNPVFFRIGYGSAGGANRPSLWLQVGRGHNGTGTITANGGALTANVQVTRNSDDTSGNSFWSYIAGRSDGAFGYLCLALWTNKTNTSISGGFPAAPKDTTTPMGTLLSIERTKDANGNDTSDGVLLLYHAGASTTYNQQYVGNTANSNVSSSIGVLTPGNGPLVGSSRTAGSLTKLPAQRWGIYPIFHDKKGAFQYPGKNVLVAYDATDTVTDHYGETWNPTQYGALRSMIYHGGSVFSSVTAGGVARLSSSNCHFITRYD